MWNNIIDRNATEHQTGVQVVGRRLIGTWSKKICEGRSEIQEKNCKKQTGYKYGITDAMTQMNE